MPRKKKKTEVTTGKHFVRKREVGDDQTTTTTAFVGKGFKEHSEILRRAGVSRPGGVVGRNIPEFEKQQQAKTRVEQEQGLQEREPRQQEEIQRMIGKEQEIEQRGSFEEKIDRFVEIAKSPAGIAAATIGLTGGLAAGGGILAGGTAAAAAGGLARITRTAETISKFSKSLTTQRAFIGKSATSGVDKLFHAVKPTASRFATNPKTIGLTRGFFLKLGLGLSAASLLIQSIGTYPFAGFIKEEASQITGFAFNLAERNDDIEGMANAIQVQEEILNGEQSIRNQIPFSNVLTQLDTYFEATASKLETDKRVFEKKLIELQGGK